MDELTPAEKLRTAIALMSAGITMKRESLERMHPNDSGFTIGARLQAWLERRPYDETLERAEQEV